MNTDMGVNVTPQRLQLRHRRGSMAASASFTPRTDLPAPSGRPRPRLGTGSAAPRSGVGVDPSLSLRTGTAGGLAPSLTKVPEPIGVGLCKHSANELVSTGRYAA